MKPAPPLSDLVRYRNELDAIDLVSVSAHLQHMLSGVVHAATENPHVRFKKNNSRVIGAQQVLTDAMENFCHSVSYLRRAVDELIEQQQPIYYERSRRLFTDEMKYETVDYILSRRLDIELADRDRLHAKILTYSDWRVPGMIIRPGAEPWIDHLVALDPLYVVDQHPDLLKPSQERFPAEYQRRMRCYVIDDRSDQAILSQLPSEQFGYVFAYNFFNFRPIELIERYLREIWQHLRPGGILLMTLNDCDWVHGAGLAERSFMCYTPGSRVRDQAQLQGYEVLEHYHGSADCAWLELRRPGTMASMRGAQTLAKIIPKSK
jgi:SAM-dependent methyltransferase